MTACAVAFWPTASDKYVAFADNMSPTAQMDERVPTFIPALG